MYTPCSERPAFQAGDRVWICRASVNKNNTNNTTAVRVAESHSVYLDPHSRDGYTYQLPWFTFLPARIRGVYEGGRIHQNGCRYYHLDPLEVRIPHITDLDPAFKMLHVRVRNNWYYSGFWLQPFEDLVDGIRALENQ